MRPRFSRSVHARPRPLTRWQATLAAQRRSAFRQPEISMQATATAAPPVQTSGARALSAAIEQFDAAADHLSLEPGLRAILRVPKRELTVRFPVRLDDGT